MISSKYQTKQWRKNQNWYKGGKHTECEKYQIKLLKNIIKDRNSSFKISDSKISDIKKTHERINMENISIEKILYPFKKPNGFEYTENFDGKFSIDNNIFYINLKFICDKGGSQTRTLKNVYNFIKYQFEILKNNSKLYSKNNSKLYSKNNSKLYSKNNSKLFFINILDGDESFRNIDKFMYIQNKYARYKYKCFIGDMCDLNYWFNKIILLINLNNI